MDLVNNNFVVQSQEVPGAQREACYMSSASFHLRSFATLVDNVRAWTKEGDSERREAVELALGVLRPCGGPGAVPSAIRARCILHEVLGVVGDALPPTAPLANWQLMSMSSIARENIASVEEEEGEVAAQARVQERELERERAATDRPTSLAAHLCAAVCRADGGDHTGLSPSSTPHDGADKSPRSRRWLDRAALGTSLCPAIVVRQLRQSGVVPLTVTTRLESRSRWHLGLWLLVALWGVGTLGGTLFTLWSDSRHHRHHLGAHMKGVHDARDYFGTASPTPPPWTPLGFRVRSAASAGEGAGAIVTRVGGLGDGAPSPGPAVAPSPIPPLEDVKPLHVRWFAPLDS